VFSSTPTFGIRRGSLSSAPPAVVATTRAVVAASFAFVGYALVSVAFAMLAGAAVTSEGNLTLRTKGLFLAPFLINIFVLIVSETTSQPASRGHDHLAGVVLYGLNVVSLAAYEQWVFGDANLLYVVGAPVIPATVATLIAARPAGHTAGPQIYPARPDRHAGHDVTVRIRA